MKRIISYVLSFSLICSAAYFPVLAEEEVLPENFEQVGTVSEVISEETAVPEEYYPEIPQIDEGYLEDISAQEELNPEVYYDESTDYQDTYSDLGQEEYIDEMYIEDAPFLEGYVRIPKGTSVYTNSTEGEIAGTFEDDAVAYAVVVVNADNFSDEWFWITFDTQAANEIDEALPQGYVSGENITVLSADEIDQLVIDMQSVSGLRSYNEYLLPFAAYAPVVEESIAPEEEIFIDEVAESIDNDAAFAGETELPATITNQPKNAKVKVGEQATFHIDAENVTAYRWQFSKDNGTTWKSTSVTGATTDTITITASETYMTYLWRCRLLGEDGKYVFSDAAKAEELLAAVVVNQPVNAKVKAGEQAIFHVNAENVKAYRWQFSKDNGTTWKSTSVSGATTDTITITATEAYMTYLWRCRLLGEDGEYVFTDAVKAEELAAAVIVNQPVNAKVKAGEQATFHVDAENVKAYRWQFSKDNGTTWKSTSVSGATTDTITITASEAYMTYLWRCRVQGEDGEYVFSDAAKAEELAAAVIVNQPVNAKVKAGEQATFHVEAENARAYRWQFSKDNGTTWKSTSVSGATTDTITITASEAYMTYLWRCRVQGEDGEYVFSDAAKAEELLAAVIVNQPVNAKVKVGEQATFHVDAENARAYRWQFSKDNGTTWKSTSVTGATTDTITITASEAYMTYLWRCRVQGEDGEYVFSESAKAEKLKPAVITKQPENVTVKEGAEATLHVDAENVAAYRWQFSKDNGTTWKSTSVTGNRTDTITFTATPAYMTYLWRCKLTGEDGEDVFTEAAKAIPAIVIDDVLYEKLTDTTCIVVSYSGNSASLTIPETVEGMTVTEIGEEAFMSNSTLESIDLPDTITIIRARAFKNCTNLKSMS